MKSILQLAAELTGGRTTSRELVEQALSRIHDSAGEGSRVFVAVHEGAARAAADAADRLRSAGIVLSPLAGIPISVKDLFDEAGHITRAASRTRDDASPATVDSAVVARLRAAGAVVMGRTNLTELAYSGLGINPHFDTPKNPWDRRRGRIPGGSSSGAAVSVTDGMAAAGIGTDTGGSVRVPAALCGITGFKTTAKRISLDGCFPLSQTLDSAGPLAPTVACCAPLDQAMRGRKIEPPVALSPAGLRLAVPTTCALNDLEEEVANCFDAALGRISAAGAHITEMPFEELLVLPQLSGRGGLLSAEAWTNHRHTVADKAEQMDPRIRSRIERGAEISAAQYIEVLQARATLIERANQRTARFDAVVMPTVPCVAPPIEPLIESDDLYLKMNALVLRNTSIVNLLDRCALSIPIHQPDAAPVGFMLMGETNGDDRLLEVGLAVQGVL